MKTALPFVGLAATLLFAFALPACAAGPGDHPSSTNPSAGPQRPQTTPENATATYYYWDHLGTTRMAAPEVPTAANVERHDYEPYGLEMLPATNQAGNTHQFTGHERDLDTGLDNMHFRYYGSNLGRFMKPDVIPGKPGDPQSWNLYAYVRGNPVNFNDPMGLWAISVQNEYDKGGKLKHTNIMVKKSKDGDNAASLAKQLGFKGKDAEKLAAQITKRFGDAGSIQLSKMGGGVGRAFSVAEYGLTEQAKYDAAGGGKTAGPEDALYKDCSMTSAKIAFPNSVPTGNAQWDINAMNELLKDRPSVTSGDERTGDVMRWGTGRRTHFSNILFTSDEGVTSVFSRSGASGAFEVLDLPVLNFESGYGPVTGEFRAEP